MMNVSHYFMPIMFLLQQQRMVFKPKQAQFSSFKHQNNFVTSNVRGSMFYFKKICTKGKMNGLNGIVHSTLPVNIIVV